MVELWLPPTAQQHPRYRCHLCRARFFRGQESEFERHVVKCGNDHEQQLHEDSIRTRLPGLYGPEAGDPEYENYVRRTGKVT